MRASEVRALGDLGGQMVAGAAGWAEQVHQTVAGRVLGSVGETGGPVRSAHDAVVYRAYGAVRVVGRAVCDAGSGVLAPLAGGSPLAGSPAGGQLVAMLDAALGDRLHDQASPLALPMTLRSGGKDVDPDRIGLAGAYPEPTSRVVLFVHGLAETDRAWMSRDGAGRPWSYAHTLEPNGWTGVAVRYNTGRHISASGVSLARLLDEVVPAWPVPVADLALIGHSMGGLVVRAACASGVAEGHRWPALVRSCVYLGSPHHGAALEQGANVLDRLLGSIAEAGPLATLLRLRSAGIQDLRHGLISADTQADDDGLIAGTGPDIPLLPTARHHFVAAHLGTSDHNPATALLGDLMVRPSSALGLADPQGGGAFNAGERTTFADTNHFGLLKDPRVAEALADWLS